MIRFATKDDLKELAKVHSAAFPDSFTTKVGMDFVRKSLEWYLSDDKKFILCILDNNKPVGYCGCLMVDGNTEMGSTSATIQYAFKEAIKGIMMKPWLLFHPELSKNYKAKKADRFEGLWSNFVSSRSEKKVNIEINKE